MKNETIKNEITRQKNRQIARLLSDLQGFPLPKVVEDRIKQAFYQIEFDLHDFLKKQDQLNKEIGSDYEKRND